ncbi:MAG: DUF3572 family protein [Rhodobacteraceae bacterium]|nr:MAG: DUF3572 family protein [Paracoccaceae bacterium]
MTRPEAEALALEALIWLSGREEDLQRLLAESGLGPDDVRRRARDPEFLGFVMEALLSDEALTRAFAAAVGAPPDAPLRARAALPGGDAPFWT